MNRMVYAGEDSLCPKKSLTVVRRGKQAARWKLMESEQVITLMAKEIQFEIIKETAAIRYYNL